MFDPYADFKKTVLPNGLEVHCAHWQNRPWVKMEIVVHSGARDDSVELPGLAHFVEHLVSKNIPGMEYDAAREFFETAGGSVEFGETGFFSTTYRFTVPANNKILRNALQIFGSMLLEARLINHIERERGVINDEFNRRYFFREALEWQMAMRRNLFKGHRLETYNCPLGRPEGISSLQARHFGDFYNTHYVPPNITIATVGGIETEEVINGFAQSPFGRQMGGYRNQIPLPIQDLLPPPKEKSKIVRMSDHVKFGVDRVDYSATWAFPASFPRLARGVFTDILANILRTEIREKTGKTYGIRSSYLDFQDVGQFEIYGKAHPELRDTLDQLVQNCVNMVPSRRDLFTRMHTARVQKSSMLDLSASGLLGNVGSELEAEHRIITMEEEVAELQRVHFEQMTEGAALLSPDRKYTLITHP